MSCLGVTRERSHCRLDSCGLIWSSLLDYGTSFLGNVVSSILIYFSIQVSKSVTDFGDVFNKDVLNTSHFIAYAKVDTEVVIFKYKI